MVFVHWMFEVSLLYASAGWMRKRGSLGGFGGEQVGCLSAISHNFGFHFSASVLEGVEVCMLYVCRGLQGFGEDVGGVSFEETPPILQRPSM